jgi:hypothetical protein
MKNMLFTSITKMGKLKYIAAIAVAVGLSGTALAGSFTFETAAGATNGDGNPVDARVVFATSLNTITISLTNLLATQQDVGQNISDLFFKLSSTANSGSITTDGLDPLVNVADGGTATSGGTGTAGWALTFSAVTGFHLDGLNGADFTPAHTILGAPDGSGVYSSANSSIAGNDPHNPFINQTATWTLAITGITANTLVTSATFSFGTQSGDNVPGIPGVPDGGSTIAFLGLARAGVELLRRAVSRRAVKA